MADYFVWNDAEFTVQVREMDAEHKEIVSKMNALHRAYVEKKSFEQTLALVNDFAAYVVKHFADEEAYMEKIKFEGLATHKIIHQQLLKQFTGFVTEFTTKKALSEGFFSFLRGWLTSHIRGIDAKYGAANKRAA